MPYALCLVPSLARGEDFHWKTSVGAMVYMAPRFLGSDIFDPFYMPAFETEYGPFFASVEQGVGLYLPVDEKRRLIFSPAIRWRVKRNLGDSWGTIQYIENIRPTATMRMILKLDPIIFSIRATSGTTGDNRGASYNFGITYKQDITEKLNLTVYTTAIYGNQKFNQTYFGITDGESAEFGFPVYAASTGMNSLDIGTKVKYFITDHWAIDGMAEYLLLVAPAAHSPIVTNRNQVTVGLGASYRF